MLSKTAAQRMQGWSRGPWAPKCFGSGLGLDRYWTDIGSRLDPDWIRMDPDRSGWIRMDPDWIQIGSRLDPDWIRIGFGLDPDSIRSVDPDPNSESGSGSRRAKMTHKSRQKIKKFHVF